MFDNYPDILSAKELADALGICSKSALKLLHDNEIAHLKYGNRYLIPKIYLIDYVCSACSQVSCL